MGVLIYLSSLRIKSIFNFKVYPARTISIILIIAIVIFYGFIFAQLYNSPKFQESTLSQDEFENYFLYFIAAITFLRGFFPSYKHIINLFPNNLPISRLEKFGYNITNEFIYPFYIVLISFVITFSFLINQNPTHFILLAISNIAIAHFSKRLVQLFIEFQVRKLNNILLLSAILLIIFFYFWIQGSLEFNLYYPISLILTGSLILINFLFDKPAKGHPVIGIRKNRIFKGKYFKMLINNSKMRMMLIIAFIVKIVFVFVAVNMLHETGLSKDTELFMYLVLSPLIFYTYVFNNFFGFSKSVWIIMSKIGINIFSFTGEIFKIFIIPLIFDLIITTSFLIYYDFVTSKIFLILLFSNVLLFGLGILNSFYFPKKIGDILLLKTNTSLFANAISMVLLITILLLSENYLTVTAFFLVFSSLIFGLLFRNRNLKNHYKIFHTLFLD